VSCNLHGAVYKALSLLLNQASRWGRWLCDGERGIAGCLVGRFLLVLVSTVSKEPYQQH